MSFRQKVVIVTGAASGIGKETAKAFSKEGANLVLVDLEKEALELVVTELGLEEEKHLLVLGDVSKEEDVQKYVHMAVEKFGRIDVLFNNAGIGGTVAPIHQYPSQIFGQVLDVNVKGTFYGLKYALPIMYEQKSGSIINTSSVAGKIANPGLSGYVASKHALIGLTKVAALEAAAQGVRVNAVCPAPVNTPMMTRLENGAAPGKAEAARAAFTNMIPLKRYGEVEDISELVLFLASDKASFITGAAYDIDGGLTIH